MAALPPAAVSLHLLRPGGARATVCEFKGVARYLDAVLGGRRVRAVAWTYPDLRPAYAALRDHVASTPAASTPPGWATNGCGRRRADFYGGWITSELVGPFKGPAGTLGW